MIILFASRHVQIRYKTTVNLGNLDLNEIFQLVREYIVEGAYVDSSDPKADEVTKGLTRQDPAYKNYKSPKRR